MLADAAERWVKCNWRGSLRVGLVRKSLFRGSRPVACGINYVLGRSTCSKACRMPPYQPARPAGLPRKCTSIASRDLLLEVGQVGLSYLQARDQRGRFCSRWGVGRDHFLGLDDYAPFSRVRSGLSKKCRLCSPLHSGVSSKNGRKTARKK